MTRCHDRFRRHRNARVPVASGILALMLAHIAPDPLLDTIAPASVVFTAYNIDFRGGLAEVAAGEIFVPDGCRCGPAVRSSTRHPSTRMAMRVSPVLNPPQPTQGRSNGLGVSPIHEPPASPRFSPSRSNYCMMETNRG